jgi:nifR3 family TIM-barrel protein
VHEAKDSLKKLDFTQGERPLAIQIFGGDVDQVREAARVVDRAGPDVIDINFGCPVKKVVCKDGGAGILRDLPKMRAITEAVMEVATRPVTVKTRLGWNDESIKILEVARILEDVGIQALAVHARTRSQMYRGDARWEWLRRIKDAGLQIPLIGNGDATTPERIGQMFDQTGVDAVMIGRGAIGNPWIFRDARHYLEHGSVPPPPTWESRVDVACEHLRLKCEWLGERKGVLEMRRMYSGYFKGFRNASRLRSLIMEEESEEGVVDRIRNFRPEDEQPQVTARFVGVRKAVVPG